MLIAVACAVLLGAACAYALHATHPARRWGSLATVLTALCWGTISAELVRRWIVGQHWPLSTGFEFSLCFIWIVLGIYLIVEQRWDDRRAGFYALLPAILLSAYALTTPTSERAIEPLSPVLRSPLMQAHVLAAMIGYGACTVAAGVGLTLLLHPKGDGGDANEPAHDWLPPREESQRVVARLVSLGFVWLTLGILLGAVWARQAWGRYWGWDPKETWAFVTWLWYLAVLHLMPLPRWRGRRIAWMVVIGFCLIVFTFAGVPRLSAALSLQSLHGY